LPSAQNTARVETSRHAAFNGQKQSPAVYAPIDFALQSLGELLRRDGFQPERKLHYICEGVGMHVPEDRMKENAASRSPGFNNS
jgi:O-methyltransferase involved in polyketide biosynthesis